jgi:hypothetical protein
MSLVQNQTTKLAYNNSTVSTFTDNLQVTGEIYFNETSVSIVNANFTNPTISSGTYYYNQTMTGWTLLLGVLLINNNRSWVFPTYPLSSTQQILGLQRLGNIKQTLYLLAGSYTVKFYACGRGGQNSGANQIQVKRSNTDGSNVGTLYSVTPPITAWTQYSITLPILTSQNYLLIFAGTSPITDEGTSLKLKATK